MNIEKLFLICANISKETIFTVFDRGNVVYEGEYLSMPYFIRNRAVHMFGITGDNVTVGLN